MSRLVLFQPLLFNIVFLSDQMRFNLISLHDRIRTKAKALAFLQDKGIIKSNNCCLKCNIKCTTNNLRNDSNYVYFRCPKCGVQESVRKDTFLYCKVGLELTNIYNFTSPPGLGHEDLHPAGVSVHQHSAVHHQPSDHAG